MTTPRGPATARDADELQRQIDELHHQLFEAQETLRAIQDGEVDAVVITDSDQPRVLTLDAADKPYRLLVEQMQQAAATLSVDGTILYCNERFARLLHQPQTALPGRPLGAFVEPSGAPLFDALLRDGLAASVESEVMLRLPDGGRVPVFLGVSALREGPAGLCLIVADLTEQKRRERLVADEALARSILEQVADAVVVCDSAGTVLRASQAAHDLCGQNPILQPFARVFPLTTRGPDDPGSPVDVAAAWRGETRRGWAVRFMRPSGQPAELLLSAGPLVAAGGEVLGAVVTLTDITALREAQEELRRRATALQDADRRKDEFLAVLAHELRNPLSPIRSSLEILHLVDSGDPHLRQSRDIIGRQVQHLTRLVDDLLEVSRIRTGRIQLRCERIDLAHAVARAVETNRPHLDAKHQHLAIDLPAAPVWVDADLTRLAQIIGNLLNNAAKYSPEHARITVQATREADQAVIRVRDDGLGIPTEMLAPIFELFTQVVGSHGRSQGGLGIGLALVKQLVVLHGGTVEAHSPGPGCGSEFTVRLPLAAVSTTHATTPAADPHTAPTHSRRLLVVDDNVDAADSLAALLGILGHDVRVAADGEAALVTAAEFQPQVVFCDIGLPLMDGYQVVAALRTRPELAATRFIALTGYGRDEDRRRSRTAGFHAHLVKPIDLAKLAAVLA